MNSKNNLYSDYGSTQWKGISYCQELYESTDHSELSPITQVQAVPFIDADHIVLYKHIDGYYGLPGGGIEPGETIVEALAREVYEEAALNLIECGMLGYMKVWPEGAPEKTHYQLRYWAQVTLLDEPVNDPCGKAISREVVPLREAIEKLNWGEKGGVLIELAVRHYTAKAIH